ncbi:MAG: radical SAM protein [Deltaproteobacteria bacterium]|nr:radical SAM protein [Deltaproteobacteria bacterium]
MADFLSAKEIFDWQPYNLPGNSAAQMARARQRMIDQGQWHDGQILGRRGAVGCVSLEITQRCNLDCTYCYLSETSEALKDIPLEEVFRRIDLIRTHYGENTDVQISGGDPTVRKREELAAIVRYARASGLRPSLFTNGIRASRELLSQLCDAGLIDVAFHVDLTQERKGYTTERSLNAVRKEYVDRARGLPLSVFFNTTVYPGNFHEVPELVQFFVAHSDVVRLCSFQVGADTGRGLERERVTVNPYTVMQAIQMGAGCALNFGAVSAGHARCNRVAYGLVINGKVFDFLADGESAGKVIANTAHVVFDRQDKAKTVWRMTRAIAARPDLAAGFLHRAVSFAWKAGADLIAARGRIGKLTFFIHNFMDADRLERERCEACSFMVMTPDGPMSMCVHNAKRDRYLLVAAQVKRGDKTVYWNPVTGQTQEHRPGHLDVSLSRKNARGRAKKFVEPVRIAGEAGQSRAKSADAAEDTL